jgi:tellurite resistance protein
VLVSSLRPEEALTYLDLKATREDFMGLFDNLFGSEKGSAREMTKSEAFAGILLGACASDGHIADEEAQGLVTIMGRMKLYENWTGEKFNSTINRLLGLIKRIGVEKMIRRCAEVLPRQLHETAFVNACDLVLADGVVEDEEKEFLEDLQRTLDVSGDQALTIIEVMVIKNRG